jgi:UDP-N-acetylglucosamine transferase subunit ALG13
MIFLTVGTQFPFDRLVESVDAALARNNHDCKIVAQIGSSSYSPRNFEAVALLEKEQFDKYVQQASCIISHAGVGIITTALDNQKPLLVMPRLRRHREVVNDHQLAIAKKFEQSGHILAAYHAREVDEKIRQLVNFVPKARPSQAHLVSQRIMSFLNRLSTSA